jgi:hypothetical protein
MPAFSRVMSRWNSIVLGPASDAPSLSQGLTEHQVSAELRRKQPGFRVQCHQCRRMFQYQPALTTKTGAAYL